MAIVFLPLKRPADLKDGTNGKLGPCQLTAVFFQGMGSSNLHPLAARAWNVLTVMVKNKTGYQLTTTPGGAYRTFEQQLSVFNTRMSPWYNPLTCTTTTRIYQGKKYWLRRGFAPVAAPEWYDFVEKKWKGGSNHGWGLAVDGAIFVPGKPAQGITSIPAVWAAYQEFAPLCGFSWEGAKPGERGWEPWHIRYVAGEDIPKAVSDMEAWFAAAAVNK